MVEKATPIYTPPPPARSIAKSGEKDRFVPNELHESLRSRERISTIPKT